MELFAGDLIPDEQTFTVHFSERVKTIDPVLTEAGCPDHGWEHVQHEYDDVYVQELKRDADGTIYSSPQGHFDGYTSIPWEARCYGVTDLPQPDPETGAERVHCGRAFRTIGVKVDWR